MKKVILTLIFILGFACIFTFASSAADMTNYCDLELTLTDGSRVTAYHEIGSWGGKTSILRDKFYKTLDKSGETIEWESVEVIDMRNTTIYGDKIPVYISGTVCNSHAGNVKEVYFPSMITEVLSSTFTSDWKSLETVYIPKNVTTFSTSSGSFKNSAIRTLIFEEGSLLKDFGYETFRDCTNLTTIVNFPQNIEKIGYCAFFCTSLGGTIVLPNSVTSVGDAAFRNTKIEVFNFGDGPITIGYNALGDPSKNKQYLKEVYIPAEATLVRNGETWFKVDNTVKFYVIGEDCSNIISILQTAPKSGYMKIVTEEEAKTMAEGTYNGVIITGYNKCDAFYKGEHNFVIENDPEYCKASCTVCGKTLDGSTKHTLAITETFANGKYVSSCVIINKCEECGFVLEETTVLPIFKTLGYSVPEGATNGFVGICQSFFVDKNELEKYEKATNKTLSYGVVAASGSNTAPLALENGVVTTVNNSIKVEMGAMGNDYYQIKITNITEANYNTSIVFTSYITDGEEILYMADGTVKLNPTPKSYNGILSELK